MFSLERVRFGNIPQNKNGPFQDLTQAPYKYKNGPFQCLKPQASPANHKSVYFDQSQTIHQPSGPNKRRPHGPVKPASLRSLCCLDSVNRIAINKYCCHWSTVVVHQATLQYPTLVTPMKDENHNAGGSGQLPAITHLQGGRAPSALLAR